MTCHLDTGAQAAARSLRACPISHAQVRDMTGTGEVLKRRLRDGQGEFPIDCPLNDTTVRAHWRVRGVRGGAPGAWLLDTRAAAADGGQQGGGKGPIEIDTGAGCPGTKARDICALGRDRRRWLDTWGWRQRSPGQ